MVKKTMVFGFCLFLFPGLLACEIKVQAGNWNGFNSVTLENEFLKVTVLPEKSGRIAEFIYKPEGSNYFLPYQEKSKDNNPLLALAGTVDHNFGGWEDWFWEVGPQKTRLTYQFLIERKEDSVSLVLKRPGGQGNINLERIITLTERSQVLKVDVKIKNQTSQEYSYWMHSMVQVGGDFNYDDYNIIPLRKCPEKVPLSLYNQTEIVSEEMLLKRRFVKDVGPMYLAGQPWWAVGDGKKDFGFGQVIRPESLIKERTVFYAWCGEEWGKPAMSQEIIFPPVKSGEERIYTIYLIPLLGVSNLSYLNPEVGIYTSGLEKIQKEGSFELWVIPHNEIKEALLTLSAKDWQVSIPFKNLIPGKKVVQKIRLPSQLTRMAELTINGRWTGPVIDEQFKFFKEKDEW